MSIFKASWIILKKTKLKENEEIITMFTNEYWKLILKNKISKRQKNLDLWYIINFEISVKKENQINEILNPKIKNEFQYNNKDFSLIIEYLELIKFIENFTPLNMQIIWIYEIFYKINEYKNLTYEKIVFSKVKLLSLLWILKTDENDDETVKKVINFILKNNIDNILKLSWIEEKSLYLLKKITNI